MSKNKYMIAIFASGAGSNAKKIIEYFNQHACIGIQLIVSNNPQAGVLDIAVKAGIETLLIDRNYLKSADFIEFLQKKGIDFIILAGFLWKIPGSLINAYPSKIINIHPALLPAYGGKGMYGHFVHEAVIKDRAGKSGITIHYVDEKYDHGATIFQASVAIEESDTAESLAEKIHQLEHVHFAPIIEKVILG